ATKRRATTKAKAATTAKTRGTTATAAAKPRATRKTSKKTADVQDSEQAALPLEEAAPAHVTSAPEAEAGSVQSTAPEPAPAPVEEAAGMKESKPAARKSNRLKVETAAAADAAGEEWSPS